MDRPNPSLVGTLVYLLIGPLGWGLHLTAIYSLTTLLCALATRGNPSLVGAVGPVILLATVVAGAVVALSALKPETPRRLLGVRTGAAHQSAFLDRAMRLLAVLSLIAIAWGGATVTIIGPCAQLR